MSVMFMVLPSVGSWPGDQHFSLNLSELKRWLPSQHPAEEDDAYHTLLCRHGLSPQAAEADMPTALDSEYLRQPGDAVENEIRIPHRSRPILARPDLNPSEPRSLRPCHVRLRVVPDHRDFMGPKPQVFEGEPEEALFGFADDGRALAAGVLQGGDERSGVQGEPILSAPVAVSL